MGILGKLRDLFETEEQASPPAASTARARPNRQRQREPLATPESPSVRLALRSQPWETTSKSGGEIIVTGYHFVDREGRGLGLARDQAAIRAAGVTVVKPSGVSHAGEVLQAPGFMPGKRVRLIADPDNAYDAEAVGVWDSEGQQRVGWVPKKEMPGLSRALRDGAPLSAVVMEQTRIRSGERVSLRLAIAREPVLDDITARCRKFKE